MLKKVLLIALCSFCVACAERRPLPQIASRVQSTEKWRKDGPSVKKKDGPSVKKHVVEKCKKKICLDAGHGGKDPGAPKMHCSVPEKFLCIDVVKRIVSLLKHRGYTIILTRKNDSFIPLYRRVEVANTQKADIFVSIHFNTSSCPESGGFEIFYFNDPKNAHRSTKSKQLSGCIGISLKETIGTRTRGVKHGNLYVIRETFMPAVLVEAAFMTNPKEAKLLSSTSFLQKIAEGVVLGIESFFDDQK